MRSIFFILIAVGVLTTGFINKGIQHIAFAKWVIERNSSLSIQGETNISSFQCDITEYLKPDTLVCSKNEASTKLNFTNSNLVIDINRFDCHRKFITEGFRNALKADENPNLTIGFINIDQFSNLNNNQIVKGVVDIELAKAVKRAEIWYVIKFLPGNRIQLNGSQVFSFSDFKLTPPERLGGMISTKDRIKVNFQLFFRLI